MSVTEEIGLLWDWRVNQGLPFLLCPEDVPVMRALLHGERLAAQPGFEWLDDATEDDE